MKLVKICCPACGANIEMDIKDHKTIFCPFCRTQFAVDNGDKTYTHNINIHERYTDDAAIEKARLEDREKERQYRESENGSNRILLIIIGALIVLFFGVMISSWSEQEAISEGKIKVGISSEDIVGKKYQGIEKQLKALGFTNIVTIDLNDAGFFKNKADTIENITIDGDSSFRESDYYKPNAKIVISYH